MSDGKFSFGGATAEQRKAAQAAQTGPSFDPIDPGWYNVSAIEVKPGTYKSPKNSGKPYLKLTLRVSEGEYTNRRLFTQIPLFPNWSPSEKHPAGYPTPFLPFFEAAGYDTLSGFEFDSISDLANELIGKEFQIKTVLEEDEWAFNNAVKRVEDEGGLASDLDPDDFRRERVEQYKAPGTVPITAPKASKAKKKIEL